MFLNFASTYKEQFLFTYIFTNLNYQQGKMHFFN